MGTTGDPGDGSAAEHPAAAVPRWLAAVTAYAWRLLVVAAAVVVLALAFAELRLVVVPTLFATIATALLWPAREALRGRGLPAAAAALIPLASALGALFGIFALVGPAFLNQLQEIIGDASEGVESVMEWLREGPLDLDDEQIDDSLDRAAQAVRDNSEALASGILSGALLALEVLIGFAMTIVITFFFLKDGDRIWRAVVGLFASSTGADLAEMGRRGWTTLTAYMRGITIVALYDAAFIGLALVIVGVPGAATLAVLTFFGAYIPIAGAVVTGMLAVLVALVSEGFVPALIVLAAVIFVQQSESQLLHPVVVGRAVALHPVGILLAVTAGALLAGVIGAFLAVPVAAVSVRALGYLRERSRPPDLYSEAR